MYRLRNNCVTVCSRTEKNVSSCVGTKILCMAITYDTHAHVLPNMRKSTEQFIAQSRDAVLTSTPCYKALNTIGRHNVAFVTAHFFS